jgi:hypothetical protein
MSAHTTHGVLAAATLASILLAPALGFAQDDSLDRLDLTIGVKGGVSGAFNTEEVPDSMAYEKDGQSVRVSDADIFPLFGLGGNVGLSVDARYAGIVGIETGFSLSFDNGEGWTDKNAANGTTIARIYMNQETTSLRVPLLLKLSTGTGTVRPVFGVGVEFVNQIDSRVTYRSENRAGDGDAAAQQLTDTYNAVPTNYMVAKGVLGMELNFDMVRIPIEIGGMYNPTFENTLNYRLDNLELATDGTYTADYRGEYEGHFTITIGVLFNYGLMFE